MRTIAWVAAALAVAFTTACADRGRRDTDTDSADRVEATGDQTSGAVREGAVKTEDTAEDAAHKVGDATKDAADKVGDAAKDAGDKADTAVDDAAGTVEKAADELGISSYSYERRDAFREDVDKQLAAMDKELAQLRHGVNEDATKTYTNAVAAAGETRKAVGRDVDRLSSATAANWDEVQGNVRASLDSLNRQLRALRPDANPMGGAGPK
jgi:hypothetical protein